MVGVGVSRGKGRDSEGEGVGVSRICKRDSEEDVAAVFQWGGTGGVVLRQNAVVQ